MHIQCLVAELAFQFLSDIYNAELTLQASVCYFSTSVYTQSAVQSAQGLIPRGKAAGVRS